MVSKPCFLCPRQCSVDRAMEPGFCGAGNRVKVARAAPHFWEEPCISGTRGSGTVFFSGCNLRCRTCQNVSISAGGFGKELSVAELSDIFLRLAAQGVHNINLVTPTPWSKWAREAIQMAREKGLSLPIVWNTGGYESVPVVHELRDIVDIWLTDLKFYDSTLAGEVAGAPDYFAVASKAIVEMARLSGPPAYDADGLLIRGTVVRMLVLPGYKEDAKKLLHWLKESLAPGSFLLSLMSQYTPVHQAKELGRLGRRLSGYEYYDVADTAIALGLTQGFMQERSSAKEEYVPPFDLTGV